MRSTAGNTSSAGPSEADGAGTSTGKTTASGANEEKTNVCWAGVIGGESGKGGGSGATAISAGGANR
ncbi:hypothetical protein ACH5RR_001254 [Cinchona calisaya]|uniref:Uncharacterized protein n=1 Tax=Cinchona calisaya TaxID=153742 RepID=A0ABD3B3P6_9GENT